jgi:hypothetical protein
MCTCVNTVNKAAAEALNEKPGNIKNRYISRETWNLIEEKKDNVAHESWDEVDRLKQEIVKAARDDKQREIIAELEELDED